MRTPFRGQSQDQVTTRLPKLARAQPESASRQPPIRVQDSVRKVLVGPAGLEPATERL